MNADNTTVQDVRFPGMPMRLRALQRDGWAGAQILVPLNVNQLLTPEQTTNCCKFCSGWGPDGGPDGEAPWSVQPDVCASNIGSKLFMV